MIRKTNDFRISFKFLIILGVIFVFSVIFFSVLVSAREQKNSDIGYKYYTSVQIHSGDTLWDIAGQYCPDSQSIKDYVNELKKINGLQSDKIHAGSYLTVVYYDQEYK